MTTVSPYASLSVTREDVIELAKEAAGNHRKFDSFAWFDRPKDDGSWTLVYTRSRDSDELGVSNAHAIAELMEPFTDPNDDDPWFASHGPDDPDACVESHSHWAVGYVDGFAIRVYGPDGLPTGAFATWCDIQARLDEYPVLDEEDWSRREMETQEQSIREEGRQYLRDDAPDDWAGQVFSWLWETNIPPSENWFAEEDVLTAMMALKLACPESCEITSQDWARRVSTNVVADYATHHTYRREAETLSLCADLQQYAMTEKRNAEIAAAAAAAAEEGDDKDE
jgi:hypothetical protein